jgi:hypothetical protein
MARIEADPSERLETLKARRKAAKKTDIVSTAGLERITGLGWRFIKLLIDDNPDFPIQKRGAEGTSYEFVVPDVLDWLIKFYRRKIVARDTAQRRIAKLAGITIPDSGVSGLSVAEYRDILRFQVEAQRLKIEQRDLIPAAQVREIMTGLADIVNGEISTMVSRNDPAGRWPADVQAMVKEDLRGLLVRIHDRFGEWLESDVRGTGGAGSRSGSAGGRRVLPGRKGHRAGA